MTYKRHTFASIARPTVRYVFHEDTMALWDASRRVARPFMPNVGEYDTLGDGDCQHTPERCLTFDVDRITDFYVSFARYLLTARPACHWSIDRVVGESSIDRKRMRRRIAWACKLKAPADGPAVYVAPTLEKSSKSDKCQHDRRYMTLARDYNGDSPRDVFHLVNRNERGETLNDYEGERFALFYLVMDVGDELDPDRSVDHAYQAIKWYFDVKWSDCSEEYQRSVRRLCTAFEAVRSAVTALQLAERAKYDADRLARDLAPATEAAEDAAE